MHCRRAHRSHSIQLLGRQPRPLHCCSPGRRALRLCPPGTLAKKSFVGDLSEGGTPGPIPNPAVKPFRADGSWGASPCESRSSPTKLFCFLMGSSNGRLGTGRQPIRAGQAGRHLNRCRKRPGGRFDSQKALEYTGPPAGSGRRSTTMGNEARKSRLRHFQKARVRFDRSRALCYNLTSLVETRPVRNQRLNKTKS